MKRTLKVLCVLALMIGVGFALGKNVSAKNITLSPSNEKEDGKYYSIDYISIRNALNEIGEAGGGTLTLKSGTYNVSNTLCVGSNTTIKFQKKVVLNKIFGKAASSTLFQLISFDKVFDKNVVSKYKGEHNIHFKGNGTVFNMNNKNKGSTMSIAVVMANNANVSFEGITFEKVKWGHLVEMDGCKSVSFKKCTFRNMADNKKHNKEAINLDTNDKETGGFSQEWSKPDKTPNTQITIANCEFKNLVRAVGTHRYSGGKYHTKIKFINNKCDKVKAPIGMLNWRKVTVTNNTFSNGKANKRYNYNFLMAGVKGITFTKNNLIKMKSKETIKHYPKYKIGGDKYKATKSKITKKEIKAMKKNKAKKGTKKKFIVNKKTYKFK